MKDCALCYVQKDVEQEIVFENQTCMLIQKKSDQQILIGSGLIIPKLHNKDVFELSKEEREDSRKLLIEVKKLLDQKYTPDGYNIGWSVEEVGGQSIMHAHMHIIPRYKKSPMPEKVCVIG